MTQHGFRIIDMPTQQGPSPTWTWRRVNAFDFAIESHPNCPIDGTPLETIAALVSLTLPEQVRVGCCPRCGLVGYIDRPSAADVDRYYAETWMGETFSEAFDKARQEGVRLKDLGLFSGIEIDRRLPVLEIGCGYGQTIRALRLAGFTDIDATESCPVRAEAVRKAHGINVSTEIPDKRYGLILSSHVLEHCPNPAALIRECAKRQETGDWMVHEVPNFQGEPSMGVLLFLPHLWSFGGTSFGEMFYRAGYFKQRWCDGTSESSLSIAVQKGSGLRFRTPMEPDVMLSIAETKLLAGLGLIPQQSRLVWHAGQDGTAWLPESSMKAMRDGVLQRSLTAGPVTEFRTQAPIEVQFPERVQVYVK